jgi:hypothetical protein
MGNPTPTAPSPTVECSRATDEEEEKESEKWITAITEGTSECTVPDDYGLHSCRASGTNQTAAVTLCGEGAEKNKWAIFLAL